MISSGFYALIVTSPAIAPLLAAPAANSVFFSLAQKQAAPPYIVLHTINAPPAEKTMDGSSALIEGEFQFDSYANDQPTARKISRALRDLLKDFSGSLTDGTIVQFTEVVMDFDEPYELGGGGYIFRSVLRLRTLYTEGS